MGNFYSPRYRGGEALNLPLKTEFCLLEELVPAAFLGRAVPRAGCGDHRRRIEQTLDRILEGRNSSPPKA
jgi:hypothetical protein